MQSVKLNIIPGFSELFKSFVNQDSAFLDLLSSNNFSDNIDFIERKTKNIKYREKLINAIKLSFFDSLMSEKQKLNLQLLELNNSLTVTTGQQIGFLAGPIYTSLKLMSAVSFAKTLSEKFQSYNFIPIFWIEDNDHDSLEASTIHYWNKEFQICKANCFDDFSINSNVPASELVFPNSIINTLSNIVSNLPKTSFTEEFADILTRVYRPERPINHSFVHLLNELFSESGILFISSSVLRKNGYFAEIATKELTNIGTTEKNVISANKQLLSKGWNLQAKVSRINLFYHRDNQRFKVVDDGEKIEIDNILRTTEDLLEELQVNKNCFSGNVILRPIFQDSLLPNIAYIAGPSEIGYLSQLPKVYNSFGIEMPAIINRHSASFFTPRIARFIEKENIHPFDLLTDYNAIEQRELTKLLDNNIIQDFNVLKTEISSKIQQLKTSLNLDDASLFRSFDATQHLIEKQLNQLHKKYNSILKQKHEIYFSKLKESSNIVFPHNSLQERVFSSINIINQIGKAKFLESLETISKQDRSYHYFVKNL